MLCAASGLISMWRAVDGDALRVETKRLQMRVDEVAERHAAPIAAHEQVVRARQAVDAIDEIRGLRFGVAAAVEGAARERGDHGQEILGAMRKLAHDQVCVLLAALARRDVLVHADPLG